MAKIWWIANHCLCALCTSWLLINRCQSSLRSKWFQRLLPGINLLLHKRASTLSTKNEGFILQYLSTWLMYHSYFYHIKSIYSLYICDLHVANINEAAALVLFFQAVLKIGTIYFQAQTIACFTLHWHLSLYACTLRSKQVGIIVAGAFMMK